MASKDLRQLIRKAEREGWEIKVTGGSHLRWTAPEGGFFFSAFSPSDWRALKKIKADMKRVLGGA